DQRVQAIRAERVQQFLAAVALFPRSVRPLRPPLQRITAIRGPEDRAAEVGDAAHFLGTERHQFVFAEQAAEAPLDPHAFPAAMHRAQYGGADDGIQPGRVAAPRGDRESHFLLAVASRIKRRTSPASAWRFVLFLE